jgi:hypothetical protein
MIKSDLLEKVYQGFQNLDGWQDSALELNVLDGYSRNLHLVASLDFETKVSPYVKIDIEIFNETLNEYVVETQQIVHLEGDDDTDVGLILDFLQDQIEYAQDIT